MARAFEENTMNCWRLMARMAGTESTANSTSVASTRTSTTRSGVAMSRSVPAPVPRSWRQ